MNKLLASNYYACLSPPPCQVEEHEHDTKQVKFKTTSEISPSTLAAERNKNRARWDRVVRKRREKEQCNNTGERALPATTTHVIGINDEEIREAMRNGTID